MINIYFDPVIWSNGVITLSWHGIFLLMAVLVMLGVSARLGRERGITPDQLLDLALWAVLPAYVAMRIPLVLEQPDAFIRQPLKILAIWEGGGMIYSALIAIFSVAALYSHRRGIPFNDLADILIMGIPVADFLGRIGCTLNGDNPGIPTGGQWGLVYWHPNSQIPSAWLGVPTWPVPTIIQVSSLVTLGVLWFIWRNSPRRGTVALTGLLLIAMGYFIAGFWRPEVVFIFGLKQRQIASLLGMTSAAILLLWRHFHRREII